VQVAHLAAPEAGGDEQDGVGAVQAGLGDLARIDGEVSGTVTAARTRSRSASVPWKKRSSVSTEMQLVPPWT
jgi:hypothetical protein